MNIKIEPLSIININSRIGFHCTTHLPHEMVKVKWIYFQSNDAVHTYSHSHKYTNRLWNTLMHRSALFIAYVLRKNLICNTTVKPLVVCACVQNEKGQRGEYTICRQLNGKDIKFDVEEISEMASAPGLRTTSADVTVVVPNNHKNKK